MLLIMSYTFKLHFLYNQISYLFIWFYQWNNGKFCGLTLLKCSTKMDIEIQIRFWNFVFSKYQWWWPNISSLTKWIGDNRLAQLAKEWVTKNPFYARILMAAVALISRYFYVIGSRWIFFNYYLELITSLNLHIEEYQQGCDEGLADFLAQNNQKCVF